MASHDINFHKHFGSQTSEWFENWHAIMAWNMNKDPHTPSQIGGVAVLMVNKLMYQVASPGIDPTGFGRWAWTRLNRNHKHV